MRRIARTTCLIGALLASLAASTPLATAGTVRGIVRYAGPPFEPKKVKIGVDHAVCGREKEADDLVVSADRGLRSAVVFLSPPPPDARWKPAPPPQMDQQQCVFVPRVIVVPTGGTAEFLNSDRLLHNLHSASTGNPVFNRTQPKGRTIPITFKRPEIIRIDCDLHPWMRAWVVVAEHSLVAVTGDQGQFQLGDVPPGRYTLHVWHERLGTVQRDVDVGVGAASVTISLGGP